MAQLQLAKEVAVFYQFSVTFREEGVGDMKRVIKVALIFFLLVLVAISLIANRFGGKVVEKMVNTVGPKALGVPVTLQKAEFSLLRGYVLLRGLKIGNPAGYKTDSLFELDALEVDLDKRSILKGIIHIRKILINEPKITYERGLTASNLSDFLAGLESKDAPAEKPVEKTEAPKNDNANEKSTVVIDELAITGARLKVSLTVAQGFSAPVPLPPIILKDIGKESGGVTFMEVIRMVFRAILGSVTGVIKGSVNLIGDGTSLVGDGAKAVGGAVANGASAVVDGIGGLFKSEKQEKEQGQEAEKKE